MEENKEKKVNEETLQPTYEQLKEACMQLQQRYAMAEARLKTIDFLATRLNYLFKVLEYKHEFSFDFIKSCSAEIEEYLTLDTKSEETEPQE